MNRRQKKKRRKFESMMQEYGGAPTTYKELGDLERKLMEVQINEQI